MAKSMNNPLSIAIIGCGTGGLAAAAYLCQDGHDVTLFERFDQAKPVGAGLLLQPTGLACLAALGLDNKALEYGAVINHLYGETDTGREIFNIHYRDLQPHYFGVGIHRGALFQILYDEVQRLGIPVHTATDIVSSQVGSDKRCVFNSLGDNLGEYDLVIDASGRNSKLRPKHLTKLNRPYPYGAIWGLLDDPEQAFGKDYLQQRYQRAQIMVGMLAIGRAPNDNTKKCTFFWSLPPGGYARWLEAGLDVWKQQVINYWPELAGMLAQFQSTDNLIFAQYSDILLRQWHDERIAFVGDAGHNSSPQLGQGANLALADALVLSRCLREQNDIAHALTNYSALRKNHIQFYQLASRWLTPFFQSDSRFCGWLRDTSFHLMGKTPYIKQEMLKTLAGIKTGYFSQLDPGNWHARYQLNKI